MTSRLHFPGRRRREGAASAATTAAADLAKGPPLRKK